MKKLKPIKMAKSSNPELPKLTYPKIAFQQEITHTKQSHVDVPLRYQLKDKFGRTSLAIQKQY